MSRRLIKTKIYRTDKAHYKAPTVDKILVEEPLSLRVRGQNQDHSQAFTTTMRTPGQDYALAKGLLWHEGIIKANSDILQMQYCTGSAQQEYNQLSIVLRSPPILPQRNQVSQSGCGVCGLTDIHHHQKLLISNPLGPTEISLEQCSNWLTSLDKAELFQQSGGCHTAAWAYHDGPVQEYQEDVGRHNAVDKLVGYRLEDQQFLSAWNKTLLLSGRVGYELVIKAIRSRFSCIIAVGAPSSQALQLCQKYRIQLIGFAKKDRFNLYSP